MLDGYIETESERWPIKNWFAVGQRTVTEHRECEGVHRWQGTIDNEGYKGRVWRGSGAGDVIEAMNKSLGPIPEGDYRIVE